MEYDIILWGNCTGLEEQGLKFYLTTIGSDAIIMPVKGD